MLWISRYFYLTLFDPLEYINIADTKKMRNYKEVFNIKKLVEAVVGPEPRSVIPVSFHFLRIRYVSSNEEVKLFLFLLVF